MDWGTGMLVDALFSHTSKQWWLGSNNSKQGGKPRISEPKSSMFRLGSVIFREFRQFLKRDGQSCDVGHKNWDPGVH